MTQVTPRELTDVVRSVYGPHRTVATVARLTGGSKKGVYRLTLDDQQTAILYVWSPAENYWPQSPDASGPFSEASGASLFAEAQAKLQSLGVPVPQLYQLDCTKARYPADLALVEDVPGGNLETLLGRDPGLAAPILTELGLVLKIMRGEQSLGIGKLGTVTGQGPSCERIVLDRALGHLDYASARIERIAAARGQLEEALQVMADSIEPRSQHALIHGELGPDHVLITAQGGPVLIDIEGLMYFDLEWEHVFLALRFGEHYRALRTDVLDGRRLRFYRLALYLSLVAGPLRLLTGDYPDPDPFWQIIHSNTDRALSFLG